MSALMLDTCFGPYRLMQQLGSGGLAVVYQAEDTRQGGIVALKVLHETFASNPEALARFEQEAQIATRLHHRHIVGVSDFGSIDQRAFLTMTYMPGGTLAQRFAALNMISAQHAVRLLRQVGSALDYAHHQGIVHRDIKLDNILLDERGDCALADFGIARAAETTRLTLTGTILGTPLYMAPEQARADMQIDYRADLYSLAVVAYLLVVGQLPFMGSSMAAILYQVLNAAPPRPSVVNPQVPPAADEVLLRGLAKHPDDRYPSADTFIEAFARAMSTAGAAQTVVDLRPTTQIVGVRPLMTPQLNDVRVRFDERTADDWYDAAVKTSNREQALFYLRKALELEPLHAKANRALERVQGTPITVPRPAPAKLAPALTGPLKKVNPQLRRKEDPLTLVIQLGLTVLVGLLVVFVVLVLPYLSNL